jgi:RNA polymerase sigma-70 factor (ECF subfamily)
LLARSRPPGDEPDRETPSRRVPLHGPWARVDRQGLRELFQAQREPLFRYLYRLSGNASDAEDLLQETFLRLWRKRDQFEGRGAIEGYLRRTAHRVFLNSRKKLDRRAALFQLVDHEPDAAPPAERDLERTESRKFLAARVREALEGLPETMREAFVLFRYEGLSCADIAEAVGAPVKTVESRIRRATLLLGERLRSYRAHL